MEWPLYAKIILAAILIGLAIFFVLMGRSIIMGFQRLTDGEQYNESPNLNPTSIAPSTEKPVHALCVLALLF